MSLPFLNAVECSSKNRASRSESVVLSLRTDLGIRFELRVATWEQSTKGGGSFFRAYKLYLLFPAYSHFTMPNFCKLTHRKFTKSKLMVKLSMFFRVSSETLLKKCQPQDVTQFNTTGDKAVRESV